MGTTTRVTLVAAGIGWAALAATGGHARADAIVDLSGSDSNAGALDLSTGSYSLWSLLGGSATGSSTTTMGGGVTTITYGGIVTTTPSVDNSKNAILRDYLVVTNSSGNQSVVSLGEIDPNFAGAANSNSETITVSGSTASLTFTGGGGAAGRDLTNVTSIQLVAAPALPGPITPAPESTAVALSGSVSNPGSYNLASLESLPSTTLTIPVTGGTDTYTGVPLWTFLDPTGNILDEYVITAGTDGYEVVLSAAELDPSLGGNPDDLLPYADSPDPSTLPPNFPASGVARTILPSDLSFAHGRWESDLATVEVNLVPEPGSLAMMLSGIIGLLAFRRNRRAANG